MKTKATTILFMVLAVMTAIALISGIAAFAGGEEEHICTYRTISNTATCTEGGQKREVCSVCGGERTSDAFALGHTMAERTIPATCEVAGVYEEYCTRDGCAEKKTEVISALGHNYVFDREEIFDCTVGRENIEICSVCSKEKRTPLGTGPEHKLCAGGEKPATCLTPGHKDYMLCSLCSYATPIEEIPALGHTYRDCACIRCDELLPVTDLTGTTWHIRADYSAPPMYSNIFSISFTLNGNSYTTLGIGCAWNVDRYEWIAMDGAIGYDETADGYIEYEAFTITFTGSNGVKDNDLILWLLANGTLEDTYVLSGTWVFNEKVENHWGSPFSVNFTSNNWEYVAIGADPDDLWGDGRGLKYFTLVDHPSYEFDHVYNSRTLEWLDQAYRTITFEGEQTVSKECYNWFTENAERIDLTGTTWHIPAGWNAPAGYGQYDVAYHYKSNYQSEWDGRGLNIGYRFTSDDGDYFFWEPFEDIIETGSYGPILYSPEEFTLTFIGGKDVTNSELIAFLMANGTLVN